MEHDHNLFSVREAEIFNILKELKECDFVVIGGYAVNAYTLPRFSVDCDIVIKDREELIKTENILKKSGYKKEEIDSNIQYSGDFVRYEKILENNFKVSIDILIERVIDRATKAVFSADWIFKNSNVISLKGKTIEKELKINIINRDALAVMKIISCRPTDIRDIFMILPDITYKRWVIEEIKERYDIKDRFNKIIEKISSQQFKDGLSGVYGYFDIKIFEKHRKTIISFLESI